MKYFIDHNKKSIHQQKFAGDRCGFVGTPITSREFTNCPNYVKQLIQEKNYKDCSHCVSVQTTLFG
ncbi:hypothetical protein QWY16_18305 [Planococcus shenhongbingii]|uniref:Uncharacterized protein n=1 Tax=Planococcus shenhongbingii TaxID=3058398 RepID=A0ABT8NC02_9BACL|nr:MULTISPECIES: hypothetical protein [unclassified Planococcus (in: firmicutes)]MDN7245318.1 hypothetical protein [Planococcus sp. N017]WKA58422.1 hypothetical protein QWY16_18305 [Planococcus sp. N016]